MHKPVNISFISTYVPRKCGIGTFTNNLAESVSALMGNDLTQSKSVSVTAMTNTAEGYKYSKEVLFEIKEKNIDDYREAAYYLNLSDTDVVNIQHEFGIFGGENGSNILTLLKYLNKPLVTTFHTVLKEPSNEQLKIVKELCNNSSVVVVLSGRAGRLLDKVYNIPLSKICYIPHGAPDVPFLDPAYYKDKFQLTDKKVLLTFGFLNPGKGIEEVLKSLKEVIKKFPECVYIILGATHPNVVSSFGEEYRLSLVKLVNDFGLQNNVIFINRFVDSTELLEFLMMSDIYISPHNNKEQVVSGTLTYALACGKAIISTPYWHAEEVLTAERGIIVPFRDTQAITSALVLLLQNEALRNKYRKKAYELGREMIWSKVAAKYYEIFLRAQDDYKFKKISLRSRKNDKTEKMISKLPEVNLNHFNYLTDSTGILQHATYNIPNRNEGYTTDDNARALLVSILNWKMFKDPNIFKLINTYTSFLLFAFDKDTLSFRNFLSYDRHWLDETGSDDCNGRALFVLGYIIKNPPSSSYQNLAKNLFDNCIVYQAGKVTSPRAWAWIIMGCIFYLQKFSGAMLIKKICRNLSAKLLEVYLQHRSSSWQWFENIVTYDNARMPQAMLMAGKYFKNKEYIKVGLDSLDWLYTNQYNKEDNFISLIGNENWFVKGKKKSKYDQQPLEIPGLIDACFQAYKITKDEEWILRLNLAFSWFLGNNERREVLHDYSTGGCFDGLSSSVLNLNQGAESTLSWLWSLHRLIKIREDLLIK